MCWSCELGAARVRVTAVRVTAVRVTVNRRQIFISRPQIVCYGQFQSAFASPRSVYKHLSCAVRTQAIPPCFPFQPRLPPRCLSAAPEGTIENTSHIFVLKLVPGPTGLVAHEGTSVAPSFAAEVILPTNKTNKNLRCGNRKGLLGPTHISCHLKSRT